MKNPRHVTRKEFIKQFVDGRRRAYDAALSAGAMTLSEAAMGLSSARREASKIWKELVRKQKERES